MFLATLSFSLIAGVILIITSFFVHSEKRGFDDAYTIGKADILNDNLTKAIVEAEDVTKDLEDYSNSVFSEMENKYQELLFLYQMIEEKREALTRFNTKPIKEEEAEKQETIETIEAINKSIAEKEDEIRTETKKMEKHGKTLPFMRSDHKEIVTRYENGVSVSEISKSLKIGQDEIRFILKLSGF